MGFFKKLGDRARVNLNNLIGQLEDPKKLADLAIIELGESKKKAERLLVTITGALKSAEEQLKTLPEIASRLTQKAEDFLKANDENNAKDMLKQKQEIDYRIKSLGSEIAENAKTKESLQRGIKAIDNKISNLKSSSTVNKSLNELHKEDAFSTFARMEEKIEAKEHEVAALNELLSHFEKKEKQDDKLKQAFDKHSDPKALDHELDKIKRKIDKP